MTRVDRMMELQALLRAREQATVAELAAAREVSERTVLRDLATLRDHGTPLETQSGPGGGVRLDRTRGGVAVAVDFAADEVIALWLAATLSVSATSLPWGAAAKRGLDKLLAGLPKDRARALRRVARRVVVGRPASPRVYAELLAERERVGHAPASLLSAIERCFTEELGLRFDYVDRHGAATRRTVEPHGLLVEPPAWYLLCRDLDKSAIRLFRLDRVRRARVLLDHRFSSDLEGVYQQWQAQRSSGG
jgi:predicted DNA-binding transcriptional regulator YafY